MRNQINPPMHFPEISTIVKGAGIGFMGTIAGTGLKYLFELIVARNLGADLFGVFFLGFTIFKLLERISTLGLHNGVLRYVSLYRGVGDVERMKGTILLSLRIVIAVAIGIAAFMVLLSDTVAISVFNQPSLSMLLKIFAIGIIFTAITEIFVFSTQAFQVIKYKAIVRMLFEPGLRILFIAIAFFLLWRLNGVVFVFDVSLVLGSILSFYYLNKIFPQIADKKIHPVYEGKRLLSFSWPLFFVGFFNLILVQINTLMLGYFKSSGEVGIYGAAQRTAFLIIIVLGSFNDIFAPIISDLYNRKEQEKLNNLFKIVTKWIFTASLPLFLILVLFSREILGLWGSEYTAGTVCLVIICVAQLINCSVGSVGYMIMMTGRTKVNLINTLAMFVVTIIAGLILIPRYGILGAAFSTAVSITFINLISLVEIYVILKMHPYRLDFYKPVLSGVIAVLAIFPLKKFIFHSLDPIFLLMAGSASLLVIYAFFILLLKIEKEEKIIINRIVSKFKK